MTLKKIKFVATLTFIASLSIIVSCKKSSTPKVAFTNADAKPLFDNYCASCHASGKSDAGKWLYDSGDFDGSIKANISKIYSEVYTRKSMPVGKSLTSAELTAFKKWYDAGYPSN